MFTQLFIQAQIKENIKTGESPAQMASNAENASIDVVMNICTLDYTW